MELANCTQLLQTIQIILFNRHLVLNTQKLQFGYLDQLNVYK